MSESNSKNGSRPVTKRLPRDSMPIGTRTLEKSVGYNKFRQRGSATENGYDEAIRWHSQKKLTAVIEAYCDKLGYSAGDFDKSRRVVTAGTEAVSSGHISMTEKLELSVQRSEWRRLESEMVRKNTLLAENEALLQLRKDVELLWREKIESAVVSDDR